MTNAVEGNAACISTVTVTARPHVRGASLSSRSQRAAIADILRILLRSRLIRFRQRRGTPHYSKRHDYLENSGMEREMHRL
ncbi:hypothetical protein MSIMFB_02234 [Mycobacterium simulans]|uniref:Uncharacterized protein n=1 Tax=Mycobacterium simulans TaxID=627089 RepID=A0A7Z7IJI4_9MYCO|nr:hypothetical protein MSIMFB_02234 [Mycobacterium simulans]